MISGEDPIRRSGAPGREVEETVADDIPAAKKSVRRKDSGATDKEKLAVKGGSIKRGVKRTDSASSLKHQRSTDSNESDNAKSASSKSTTEDEGKSETSLQRKDLVTLLFWPDPQPQCRL